VQARSHSHRFGTSTLLRIDNSPYRRTFLRFTVTGVGSRRVTHAAVQLTVGLQSSAASDSGGTIYQITNNSWSEARTTYFTRPAIDGPGLFTLGAVARGQVIDFDVTAAVTGDGTYNFALGTPSINGVEYRSREAATGRPALVLTLGAQ
jgi:hypothetical protein